MRNIPLVPYKHASSFRRIAAVAWDHPRDPTIYGTTTVPADALMEWIAAERERTGEKITVTHAVARAVAMIMRRHPDLNALVRWGRLWLRRDVDVFLQVAIEDEQAGKVDLSGVLIRQADTKDCAALSRELRDKARKIRSSQDKEFERTKSQANLFPPLLYRALLKVVEFCQYELNLDISFLGAPRDPFGSAMVTSLGMKGVELAYAPFFPLARSPMLILVGAVREVPAVVDGQVVVQKELILNGTFDHRVIDGFHGAMMSKEIRDILMHPEQLARTDGGGEE